MPDREVKQGGFSAVKGAVLLVAVFILGSAVWLVHNHYKEAHQVSQNSNAVSLVPAATSTVKNPVLVQLAAAVANQNVEKIPELGIQIIVPDDIKDLKYQVSTVTLKNGNQATLALFSTAALIALDSKCGTSFGPLGSLERANEQYPSSDKLAGFKYGQLVKQFSTFYVAAGSPNAACSTNASANAAAIKFKSEFITSESTIQQSN
jgi:hypothetical protein